MEDENEMRRKQDANETVKPIENHLYFCQHMNTKRMLELFYTQ